MSEHQSDPKLDRELRGVPLPDGLLGRLRQVARWDDARIDESLRDAPLPAGLIERLYCAVGDAALDESICEVPLPWGLLARLRIIPFARRRSRFARMAVAASLFFMISGSYLAAMFGLATFTRPTEQVQVDIEMPYNGPLELHAASVAESVVLEIVPDWSSPDLLADNSSIEMNLVSYVEPSQGPVSVLLEDMAHGARFEDDFLLIKYQLLTARPVADDAMPQLNLPPQRPRRGIEPPLVRQYNRRFLLHSGVHPPVIPADHPDLQSVSVPLSTGAESYRLTERRVADGRLPAPEEIRTEDFLAAIGDYLPPADAGQLGLRVSGGPSLFGRGLSAQLAGDLGWPADMARQAAALVHVGVSAGAQRQTNSQPVHLTIALDVSTSMRWADRLANARQAVKDVIKYLGPHDRISLLAFNEKVVCQVEGIGRGEVDELYTVLDGLKAQGGTNLGIGLPAAVSLAMRSQIDSSAKPKLVLMTDGRANLGDDAALSARDLLAHAARFGLAFSVIELDDDDVNDSVLASLADAARGRIEQIMTTDRLRWTLVEALTGQPTLAATDIRLQVTFRPQVVAAYRLMGHEAEALAGLAPVAVESELHRGESAGALFEVWLNPGTDDVVGWADIQWREPETGEERKLRQPISRQQFATSFAESSLSLQAATIAAETAEALRQSPFSSAARSRSLREVLDLAAGVSGVLAEQREFREFVATIQRAEAVRMRRGTD